MQKTISFNLQKNVMPKQAVHFLKKQKFSIIRIGRDYISAKVPVEKISQLLPKASSTPASIPETNPAPKSQDADNITDNITIDPSSNQAEDLAYYGRFVMLELPENYHAFFRNAEMINPRPRPSLNSQP